MVCRAVVEGPDEPTAVHTVALTQSTASRTLYFTEGTCGLEVMAQVDPVQVSTRLSKLPELSMEIPTAWQEDAPAQETPRSSDQVDPEPTFGVGTMVHVDPFQVSATVISCPGTVARPTVRHHVVPMQVTAWSWVLVAPVGAAGVPMDHAAPFHCRIMAALSTPLAPAAMQKVAEVHDTLEGSTSVEPVGMGLGTIDQVAPFHISVSGTTWLVAMSVAFPTDMQKLGPTQETDTSWTAV